MLDAVSARHAKGGALAGAFVATAFAGAAGGVWGAARLARWAARLAPEDLERHGVPEFEAKDAPRVVVPLVKPTGGQHLRATSSYDVGDTMQHGGHSQQQMHGAVQA
jgi:hypothetical protein